MQIRNTPPGTDLHRRVHFWGGYRGRPTAAPPWVRCRRYVSRCRGEPRSSAAEANDTNTPMQTRNTPPGTDLHRRVHFWGFHRGRPMAAPTWMRCRRYVSRRRGEHRSSAAEANDDNTPMQIRNTHRVRICIGVFIFGGFTADGQWPPLRGCVAADAFLAAGASIARPRQRPAIPTRRCKSATLPLHRLRRSPSPWQGRVWRLREISGVCGTIARPVRLRGRTF